jgi:hypothetical protein
VYVVRTCRSCERTLSTGEEMELCAVDACPICVRCWEAYGYASHHTDDEINRTSLMGPDTKRWPEHIRWRRGALGSAH